MAIFSYVRVSSDGQSTERQLADLKLDRIFVDHASGKNTNRPELQNFLTHLRKGDVIYIHSMDRLAWNPQDLLKLVEKITSVQTTLIFVKENLTFSPGKESSPTAVLLLQLLGAVAQFERSLIKERQHEEHTKAECPLTKPSSKKLSVSVKPEHLSSKPHSTSGSARVRFITTSQKRRPPPS